MARNSGGVELFCAGSNLSGVIHANVSGPRVCSSDQEDNIREDFRGNCVNVTGLGGWTTDTRFATQGNWPRHKQTMPYFDSWSPADGNPTEFPAPLKTEETLLYKEYNQQQIEVDIVSYPSIMASSRKQCRRRSGNSKSRKRYLAELQPVTVPQQVSQDEHLKHHLLKMLVTDLLPFSKVKDVGFRAYCRALNPTFDPPSSALWVRTELQSVYEHIKAEVRNMLQSVPEVALTAEMWTHTSEGVYLTVSCHFIDRYWKRRNCLLETVALDSERDASRVAEQLLKTSSDWGIADKVKVVVSNMICKGSMTESCEAKGWAHVRCFVCNLDIVFREALAKLDEPLWRVPQLLRKCRAIVRFFQQERDAQRQLRANQEKLNLSPLRLVQAAAEDTWLDVGTMLQRLSEQRAAINLVLLQHVKEDLWLNDRDVEKINSVLAALQPLRDTAKEMVSDGYESLSNIIPLVDNLQKSMARLSEDGNQVAKALADVCLRRFSHAGDHRWMALSTAMDPRFKNIMLFSSRAQTIEQKLQAELKALCPSKDASPLGFGTDEVDAILKKYKSTNTMVRDQNPLDFWRLPRGFKKLSHIAQKYLTVVSTAVPLQRAFNPEISRRVHHSRCHLEPENVNLMMFLNGHWSIESSNSPESE
ncbi:E3 SUMO-protein ligase ZBED1-like isoform X3 [Alosa alosa]|uniref:E3 SUMO-protein ligase ZBED1-like isoform X3 n=1 Tax=Alosa alosa TaxID=278164 RepID=UPI0020154F74|nr:E3 SUMO-protein ligase ZBED1-like isoform X3 [Alosa alosa]